MTTRAGLVALISSTLFIVVCAQTDNFWVVVPSWSLIIILPIYFVLTGALAAWVAGTHEIGRSTLIGMFAGALFGALIYCFWIEGIEFAGMSIRDLLGSVVDLSVLLFFTIFIVTTILGTLGGLLYGLFTPHRPDVFNLNDPQMALNASLSADIAAVLSVTLTAAFYSRMAAFTGSFQLVRVTMIEILFILLFIQGCLTIILPHETRMAQHRPGLDEVRMAAFIDIFTGPLVILAVVLLAPEVLVVPWVIGFLKLSAFLSLIAFLILKATIQPRRALLPAPGGQEAGTKTLLFGSIGNSHSGRLMVLCFGCAIVLVLPFSIPLITIWLSLNELNQIGYAPLFDALGRGQFDLRFWQILINGGLMLALGILLSAIYLFYLFLGRKFGSISEQ